MFAFVSLPFKAAVVLITLATAARAGLSAEADPDDHSVPAGRRQRRGRTRGRHVLTERLGKQVIVDNRAGAGGVIGSELAANAPKDGYTLLMVSLAHTVNPWLYDLKGRYDPIKSFTPVAMIAASPVVLVVNPNVPVNSVADLVALAKKQPGKLQYASPASAA
jgi:tripartite-type tricarboxylate transporter receptor subunit TctC